MKGNQRLVISVTLSLLRIYCGPPCVGTLVWSAMCWHTCFPGILSCLILFCLSGLSVLIIKEMHVIAEYVITSYYVRHWLHNFEVGWCEYYVCLSLCNIVSVPKPCNDFCNLKFENFTENFRALSFFCTSLRTM
jgi:hypothetical protein